jgi:hypothetical protein
VIYSLSAIRLRKFRFTTDDCSDEVWHMRTSRFALIAVALLIGCGLSASPAWAGYTVTLVQQGSDVVATGSGPIDLTGLTFFATFTASNAEVQPNAAIIATGPATGASYDTYTGLTGPMSFGGGTNTVANSGSGDLVVLNGTFMGGALGVPHSYVSGTALSDSSTYDNQTFSSLGVTPGTYEWTWGTGANQSFTLVAVPEPPVWLLLVVGVLFLVSVNLRELRLGSSAALPKI